MANENFIDNLIKQEKEKETTMTNQEIFDDAIQHLSAYRILESARRNEERPFGMVIDYLKDCYSIPKTRGWDIAWEILNYFNIKN